MASLSVDDCIHEMFTKPVTWTRQYQADAIRDICADDKHTLVVKGTGQGKTWVLLGAFLLRWAEVALVLPSERQLPGPRKKSCRGRGACT